MPRMWERGVYPRPRGGAFRLAFSSESLPRSIPAHAGEPLASHRVQAWYTVYPRPRGGAGENRHHNLLPLGLSPPTRGSRSLVLNGIHWVRSIPAHAGEPLRAQKRTRLLGVYPRPRGGAGGLADALLPLAGLSPPTRGSQAR